MSHQNRTNQNRNLHQTPEMIGAGNMTTGQLGGLPRNTPGVTFPRALAGAIGSPVVNQNYSVAQIFSFNYMASTPIQARPGIGSSSAAEFHGGYYDYLEVSSRNGTNHGSRHSSTIESWATIQSRAISETRRMGQRADIGFRELQEAVANFQDHADARAYFISQACIVARSLLAQPSELTADYEGAYAEACDNARAFLAAHDPAAVGTDGVPNDYSTTFNSLAVLERPLGISSNDNVRLYAKVTVNEAGADLGGAAVGTGGLYSNLLLERMDGEEAGFTMDFPHRDDQNEQEKRISPPPSDDGEVEPGRSGSRSPSGPDGSGYPDSSQPDSSGSHGPSQPDGSGPHGPSQPDGSGSQYPSQYDSYESPESPKHGEDPWISRSTVKFGPDGGFKRGAGPYRYGGLSNCRVLEIVMKNPELFPPTPAGHEEEQRCEWQGCEKSFMGLQKLWEHVEFGHVGRKGLRTGKGLELNCKWGTCEVRCKRRCYILSHLRVHIPHKQWPCPVCLKDPAAANYGPKVFKRNFDLGKHLQNCHPVNWEKITAYALGEGEVGAGEVGGKHVDVDEIYGADEAANSGVLKNFSADEAANSEVSYYSAEEARPANSEVHYTAEEAANIEVPFYRAGEAVNSSVLPATAPTAGRKDDSYHKIVFEVLNSYRFYSTNKVESLNYLV